MLEAQFEIAALSDIWKRRRVKAVTLISEKPRDTHVRSATTMTSFTNARTLTLSSSPLADFQHRSMASKQSATMWTLTSKSPTAHTMGKPASFAKLFDKLAAACEVGTQTPQRAQLSARQGIHQVRPVWAKSSGGNDMERQSARSLAAGHSSSTN